jgi:CheY-like chemotaxis protein
MRALLFKPFMQAPQTLDHSRGGLGLGLAMVKGLVELHGGSVNVASAGPGAGADFTVRLPLAAVTPQAASERAPPRKGRSGERRRVLVIEDNVDAADTLQLLLTLEGHDVRVAYDGRTGLAIAHDFHPEIVFCDIGLPGMDGYEVARAMRKDSALEGAWLFALSGYTRPEDRERAAEAGFDAHLAKPPSLEALEHAILEHAGRRTAATARRAASSCTRGARIRPRDRGAREVCEPRRCGISSLPHGDAGHRRADRPRAPRDDGDELGDGPSLVVGEEEDDRVGAPAPKERPPREATRGGRHEGLHAPRRRARRALSLAPVAKTFLRSAPAPRGAGRMYP